MTKPMLFFTPALRRCPLALAGPAPGLHWESTAEARLDEVADLLKKGKQQLVDGSSRVPWRPSRRPTPRAAATWTRDLWLQRARMSNGALDEAFERILELESSTENPANGSLRHRRGALPGGQARRGQGGAPGGPFDEARGYLKDAVDADGDAYPDAWRMLAESARFVGDAETASMAIDRALGLKKDAGTLALASKIRIARGSE